MDYLRDAIWQEGYAQKDPVHVYRQEGHALFHKMLGEIRKEVSEELFSMQFGGAPTLTYTGPDVRGLTEERITAELPLVFGDGDEEGDGRAPQLVGATATSAPALRPAASPARPAPQPAAPASRPLPTPQRAGAPQSGQTATSATTEPQYPKVGRNDPCPCGSGKKYKKCHGKTA